MTMLTPRGVGVRRRRGRTGRRVVGVVLALALLGGAGFAAWWFGLRDRGAAANCPAPVPTGTATPRPAALPAKRVTVNVYNATSRRGLAAEVAVELRKRGFPVKAVANDPLERTVRGVAEVRRGARGAAGAQTVLAHAGGAAEVRDKRADASVDLVLGAAFRRLRTAAEAAAALAPGPAVTAPPGC
jgi:hypothetical protein